MGGGGGETNEYYGKRKDDVDRTKTKIQEKLIIQHKIKWSFIEN